MKKLLCFLLGGGVLLTGIFAGCAKPRRSIVSVEIWTYYNGPQKTAFDKLIDEFNTEVGIVKNIVASQTSKGGKVDDLIDAITASAKGEVGSERMPQMFLGYADTAFEIDKLGKVAALDSYFTKEELSAYVDGYVEEGRFDKDGSLKIFPTAKSTEILMLNKTDWDKFASAAGSAKADLEKLSTVEGIVEIARDYYEWTDGLTPDVAGDGKAFFGRDGMANYLISGCMQLGTELFEVVNGKVTFQIKRDVMKKLWDNYYVPMVSGWFGADDQFRSEDIKFGKLLAMVCSSSGAKYFPQKVVVPGPVQEDPGVSTSVSTEYAIQPYVAPFPVFQGGEKVAIQQGAGIVVVKSNAAVERACVEFLKWFTQKERNIRFAASTGYLPVTKEANDVEEINRALGEDGLQNEVVKLTLPVSIDTVKDYRMYTNKAFEGGTQARRVLEDCLTDKIEADCEAIAALVEGGTSHADAVAQYTTDDNFDVWLGEFTRQLNAVV